MKTGIIAAILILASAAVAFLQFSAAVQIRGHLRLLRGIKGAACGGFFSQDPYHRFVIIEIDGPADDRLITRTADVNSRHGCMNGCPYLHGVIARVAF